MNDGGDSPTMKRIKEKLTEMSDEEVTAFWHRICEVLDDDDEPPPTTEEVQEYCRTLGIDTDKWAAEARERWNAALKEKPNGD